MKRSYVLVLKSLLLDRPERKSWHNELNKHWTCELLADHLNRRYKKDREVGPYSKDSVFYALKKWEGKSLLKYSDGRWNPDLAEVVEYTGKFLADPELGDDCKAIYDAFKDKAPKKEKDVFVQLIELLTNYRNGGNHG